MSTRRLAVVLLGLAAFGFAGQIRANQPKPAEGLDSLSEDVVLNDLAARGMDTLLEHAFAAGKVPIEKQNGIRTIISLRRLGDPSVRLSQSERQKLVRDIVAGIEVAMPTIKDPRLLLRQAADLITAGIEREVNTLEYWGDSPSAQGALRPVARVVLKLLEQAQAEATRLADEESNRIKNPDDKAAIDRYTKLDQLAHDAEYTRHMAGYFVVLASDRADPTRRQLATQSIEYLTQFDTADQPIRARVRNRIAKLHLAVGESSAARTMLESVIAGDPKLFPTPPDLSQLYEARYFLTVVALTENKLDEATRMLDQLIAWQEASLPDPSKAADDVARGRATETRLGAAAASAMLRYRILSKGSEVAADPKMAAELNDQALAVLFKLLRDQPSMKTTVYEQLVARLPQDAKMSALDALLLQAIVQRGESEMRRTDAKPDSAILERALAGAIELSARSDANLEPQIPESAALLVGLFHEKLGRKSQAAGSLLNFVEKYPNSKNVLIAIDTAQSIIGELRRATPDEKDVVELYERFLPIAIEAPFSRKQFAYEYARRLQLQGKASLAAAYFRRVPADDPRLLQSRFFLTIALQQQLDAPPANDPQRGSMLAEIQRSADELSRAATTALSAAENDEQRTLYRSMLVRTTLLAADLARSQQNDAKRALELLQGFEAKLEGLPDAPKRLSEMLLIRVEAHMLADQYNDATAELVKLLERDPQRGGGVVYELLQKLNAELDKAQAANDVEAVKHAAGDRSQLTGFLVEWARKNGNPAIRKLSYGYAVFDAEVQRFAAVQLSDAAQREAGLRNALALFEGLQSEASLAEFKQSLPADQQSDPNAYDPSVVLGLARTHFDLGAYQEARDRFNRLLSDKRLGNAILITENRGVQVQTDNDNYWEAVVKLIQSNLKLGIGVEESEKYLKQQLVRWSDRAGGTKWKREFEELRKQLAPDFESSPAATTQSK